MIRPLRNDEVELALAIINEAARAYQGVIPDDCWQEPYMPGEELRAEIAAGVDFWAYEADGAILGVMGRQPLTEVTLIRHAYVLPGGAATGPWRPTAAAIYSRGSTPPSWWAPGPRPGGPSASMKNTASSW